MARTCLTVAPALHVQPSALDARALLVVDGVLDDLAGDLLLADLRLDPRSRDGQVLAHLRQAQRLAAEERRLDRLRDETDVLAVHREPRARRRVAAGLERHARQPECRRLAVARQRLAPLELPLVERHRPAETA